MFLNLNWRLKTVTRFTPNRFIRGVYTLCFVGFIGCIILQDVRHYAPKYAWQQTYKQIKDELETMKTT